MVVANDGDYQTGISFYKALCYTLKYDFVVRLGVSKRLKSSHENIIPKRIHFVYFSCKAHFKYLAKSLESLAKIDLGYMGNIYLYVDRGHFLSHQEIDQLKTDLLPAVSVRKTRYEMSWGGPNVVINELTAYKEVMQEMNKDDYLAKVDSDVLFLSRSIFEDIIRSGGLLIGQKETYHLPYLFTQGACYFVRKPLIFEITQRPLFSTILKVVKQTSENGSVRIENCPEDAVVYELARQCTDKIEFKEFCLPISKIHKITKEDRKKYSIIHFESSLIEKGKMLEVAEELDKIGCNE